MFTEAGTGEGVGDEENKKGRETHISISEGRIYHSSGKKFPALTCKSAAD